MNIPPLDHEGFLKNTNDWNTDVAQHLAQQENIVLTPAHWDVIRTLQAFYKEFEVSPAMRPFTKYIALTLGKDKGSSLYLLKLFPGSPAKIASKIAGLPKPENCL